MASHNAHTYLVCGSKPWNRRAFDDVIRRLPGEWHFVAIPTDLTVELLDRLGPRYAFFLHWSHKVPNQVLDLCECVCFHMADVPYGRGGSPLQNLILAGFRETKLTALRMTNELDAGPVYLKKPMSLEGTAEEVYIRATYLAARMIEQIVADQPTPIPQLGEPTVFHRRKPAESELPDDLPNLDAVYDFLRMLDADGYPHAYLRYGRFRLEFARVGYYDGRLVADVTFTVNGERTE